MSPASAAAKTISASGLIAVVATCGLLVACGSSSSSSKAAVTPSPAPKAKLITSVEACKLVTAADASTATGVTVTDIGAASGAAQTPGACLYGSADFTTSVIVEAQVYPSAAAAGAVSPETLATTLKGSGVTGTAKVVTGIGDKAVEYTFTTSGTTGGTLIFAFKSNVLIIIIVTPSTDPTAVENLARIAVGRL